MVRLAFRHDARSRPGGDDWFGKGCWRDILGGIKADGANSIRPGLTGGDP
jgi:hypothetical protein